MSDLDKKFGTCIKAILELANVECDNLPDKFDIAEYIRAEEWEKTLLKLEQPVNAYALYYAEFLDDVLYGFRNYLADHEKHFHAVAGGTK